MEYGEVLDTYEAWLIEADELIGALILDPQPDHLLIWSSRRAPASQARGRHKPCPAARRGAPVGRLDLRSTRREEHRGSALVSPSRLPSSA
jgi:hypothetical protein